MNPAAGCLNIGLAHRCRSLRPEYSHKNRGRLQADNFGTVLGQVQERRAGFGAEALTACVGCTTQTRLRPNCLVFIRSD